MVLSIASLKNEHFLSDVGILWDLILLCLFGIDSGFDLAGRFEIDLEALCCLALPFLKLRVLGFWWEASLLSADLF